MKTSQSAVANNSAALGRSALGASAGQRLPVPPRERKPALAALAVLLILGGALTSAYLVIQSGERVSAIQIVQSVAAGQKIPLGAMREVQIGDTGIEFINWKYRQRVAASTADVQLVPGTLLTNAMLRQGDNRPSGRVTVGLALKAGQLPAAGVDPGARVGLYAVGNNNSGGVRPGTVLATDAVVLEVRRGDQRLGGDQTMVDVAVLPGEAPQVAQAASAGQVAIALLPPGTRAVAPPRNGQGQGSGGQQSPTPGAGDPTDPTGDNDQTGG